MNMHDEYICKKRTDMIYMIPFLLLLILPRSRNTKMIMISFGVKQSADVVMLSEILVIPDLRSILSMSTYS